MKNLDKVKAEIDSQIQKYGDYQIRIAFWNVNCQPKSNKTVLKFIEEIQNDVNSKYEVERPYYLQNLEAKSEFGKSYSNTYIVTLKAQA